MPSHSYAQTIPQLYNQLLAKGMPVSEILKIRDAYQFAMEIYSCRFQESGKVFLGHIVGTASILTSLDAPVPLIAAGLLHNVYENGDFGCSVKQLSPDKQNQIVKVLGQDVEEYVYAFRKMRWNPNTIPGIYRDLHQFNFAERGALLIRLADWLEHHLDLGECYRPPSILRNTINESCCGLIADIATALGHPGLGSKIVKAIGENARAGRFFQKRTQAQKFSQTSEVTTPKSCRKRVDVVASESVRSSLAYIRRWSKPNNKSWAQTTIPAHQNPSVCGDYESASFIKHPYAQTSLQLFNQLRGSGYSQEELQGIKQVHDFGVSLVSGIYRPSWKSVMSHFVGVASILVAFGATPQVVAAGVIHNAYRNGDFGTGSKGMTEEKRNYVQSKLGSNIEKYLAGFARLRWKLNSLPTILNDLPTFNDIDRSVVLIRLADHLERFLDRDILYCGETEKQKYFDQTPLVLKIANGLGHKALASEIELYVADARHAKVPIQLSTGWNESYFLKPNSFALRLGVSVRKQLKQGRRRLASVLSLRSRSA